VAISGFEGFKDWIEADGELTTVPVGAPLSYKLRYLGDNSITNVVLASEYYVRNTVKINDKFRVTILEIVNMRDYSLNYEGDIFVYAGYEGQGNVSNDLVASYNTPKLNFRQKYPIHQFIEYDFDENNLENAYIRIRQIGDGWGGNWKNIDILRDIKIQDVLDNIINGTPGDDINGRYYLIGSYQWNTHMPKPGGLPSTAETRLHFVIEPIE